MSVRRCYVAGPMTGLPDFNIPAFERAAEALRGMGYEVVVPHEVVGYDPDLTHADYMRACLGALLDGRVTDLVLLPGWPHSEGARMEFRVALGIGLRVSLYWEPPGGRAGLEPIA